MADTLDPGELDSPVLAAIYAYWQGLSGGRSVVAWSEIAPERIPRKALPYVIAAQRVPNGDYRYRLSGTAVDAVVGAVPQGRYLSELPLDRGEAVRRDFDRAIDELRPVLSSFPMCTPANQYPETKRLIFPVASRGPVASGGAAADMVFGAISYADPER